MASSPASSPNGNILGHIGGVFIVTASVETASGYVVSTATDVIAVVVVLGVVVVVAAAGAARVVVVEVVSELVVRVRTGGLFEMFLYITALYIPITKVTAMMTQEAMVIICHLCFTSSLHIFVDDLELEM